MESEEDYVLKSENEAENERQMLNFVITAKELYAADGIRDLTDLEVAKWLVTKKGHRGKALEALSETLVTKLI